MHEKADKSDNKLSPDVFWIKEDTAYVLPSIKMVSSSVKMFGIGDNEKYYFEVDGNAYTYNNKKQAYKEYSDLIKKLNVFHAPFISYKTND